MLGSVKSNIGHLEVASGIAGLIKAILCLKHRAIPATLHFTSPNPELRLDQGPFTVQSDYGPWEWDGVRRAGVSSFGVGGTNAHVVLEEAPGLPARDERPGPQVLLLSARTAEALRDSRSALATELSGPDPLDMSDVAFTLARRRKDMTRMAAVVHDRPHAATVLQDPSTTTPSSAKPRQLRSSHRSTWIEWFSCSPAKARSMPGWPSACTRPSRYSQTTSTAAQQASSMSWASTCGPRSSTVSGPVWNEPTARSLRSSRSNMRWRS